MEEGCTIDAKFRNVDIENVLTAGSFTISDDIAFENINVQNDLTVANDATILSSLTVSKNSTTLLSVTQSDTNITNSLNVTGPLTSSNLQVKNNLIKTHTINNEDRVSFNLTGDPDELVDINGNVKIRGTLTVEGAQTSNQQISSTSNSPLLELASGFTGTPSNDGGLIIIRGNEPNAFIGIDESLQKFTMGTGTFTSSSTGNLSITPGILVMNTFEGNLIGNVTGNVTGNITGNANTVTNGIYTTSSVTELSDISSSGSGSIITNTERTKLNSIEENADVTDSTNVYNAGAVMTTGNYSQTITGTKTFSDTITGSITGNAGSVTNGVYTSGDQTINGIKTFTQTIQGDISGNSATSSGILGTLSITQGGTGATSLNNLIILGTHTNGNYVSTITVGNDLSTTGTNIENSNHTISLNSNISSVETIYNSNLIIGNNSNNNINFSTNEINFKISNINQLKIIDGSIIPIVTNDIDIGSSTLKYKNAYFDGIIYGNLTGNVTGDVTGNVTGNLTGNADTVTNGIYTTSSVTELSDISSSGSGSIITNTERTKLNSIEENADVTDSTNVYNAGAVMTTGNYSQTITGTKTFSNTIIGDLTGNVTINNGDTLDVSNGTLTLANDQISGDKIEGGTINNITVNNLTTSFFDVNTISSINSNGNITLDPNGTGNTIIDSNVGIGTTIPTAKLHIRSNTTGQSSLLILESNTTNWGGNDDGASIEFRTYETGNGMTISQAKILVADPTTNDSGDADLVFQTRGTVLGESFPSVTEKMRIDSSGNIGIGTNSPDKNLHIYNSTESIIKLHKNVSSSGSCSLEFHDSTSIVGYLGNNTGRNLTLSNLTTSNLVFQTNSSDRMIINSSGNVGIGTTDPSEKLVLSKNIGLGPNFQLQNIDNMERVGFDSFSGVSPSVNPNTSSYLNFSSWPDNWFPRQFLYINRDIDKQYTGTGPDLQNDLGIEFGYSNYFYRSNEANNGYYPAGSAIRFHTANNNSTLTEKMCIDYQGNVGIGITNPTSKLHIYDTSPHLKIESASNSTSTLSLVEASNQGAGLQFNGNHARFFIGTFSGSSTLNKALTINRGSNKLGINIGDTDPLAELHVNGDSRIDGTISYGSTNKTASLYIKGTGLNNNANRLVILSGETIVNTGSGYRGLTLTIINGQNLQHVSSTNYDTYGSTTNSDNLATAINNMTHTQIGILTSYDSFTNYVTSNLRTAAIRVGLTKLYQVASNGEINATVREPYAAIFYGTSSDSDDTPKYIRDVIEIYRNNNDEDINDSDNGTHESPPAIISTTLSSDGNYAGIAGASSVNALWAANPDIENPVLTCDKEGNININGGISGENIAYGNWNQLGADIDGEAPYDRSGYSVSLSSDGTIVAIGANENDGNGANSGHVRVYQYSGSSWTQLGQDIDGATPADESGFSVSLSSDGTIVAIGALYNDGNALINSGHVRVYEYSGSSWTQLGTDIDGEASNDNSGQSVSLNANGNIVAIGAKYNDGNGTNSGHVRVYQYIAGLWTQLGADIDGEASNDWSGNSVSLSSDGTIVAIGANLNNGVNGSDSGHVRVYQYSGSSWTQLGADIDGEAGNDESGYSVSLSSDGYIVAIGALYNDGNNSNSGHVRVYQYSGSSWTQIGQDIDGEAGNDNSGNSVSLSSDGTIVAIGAHRNDGNNYNSGHVRVYKYIGSSWTQLGADIDGEASTNQSGYSVSLSSDGTIVAIGATHNHGVNGFNSGHVRVYKIDTNPSLSINSHVGIGTTNPQSKLHVNGDSLFNGNVGIGTTSPQSKLHMHQADLLLDGGESHRNNPRIVFSENTVDENIEMIYDGSSTGSGNYFAIRSRYSSWDNIGINYQPSTGHVGIGTTSPNGYFHVNGSISTSIGLNTLFDYDRKVEYSSGGTTYSSITASQGVIANFFRATSDERIKKNFKDLNDYEYLQKIKKLKPYTYQYIDIGHKTDVTVTGFKAQEVKNIIPGSVGTTKDYIPNIYKKVPILSKIQNTIITIENILEYNLSIGNILKIYEYLPDTTLETTKQSLNIKSINGVNITLDGYLNFSNKVLWIRYIGECNVDVKGDINTDTIINVPNLNSLNLSIGQLLQIYEREPNDAEKEHTLEIINIDGENVTLNGTITTSLNEIFVYGKEVDDLHNLSNDRITPVCVAGIQEIDRRVVSHFTGSHTCYPENESLDYNNYIGLIVISTGSFKIKYNDNIFTGKQAIRIDHSTPQIRLSNVDNQKSVLGVVSLVQDDTVLINSSGEGGIWVCNKNGNLENGDYISSSSIPGYGILQYSNKLLNSTVGKIRCNIDFNSVNDYDTRFLLPDGTQITEIEYNNKLLEYKEVYKAYFVGCTYNC